MHIYDLPQRAGGDGLVPAILARVSPTLHIGGREASLLAEARVEHHLRQ